MAQLVKNLPAMPETWVQSLGWDDLLEMRKITHSSILAWRIPWTVAKSQTQLSNFHFTSKVNGLSGEEGTDGGGGNNITSQRTEILNPRQTSAQDSCSQSTSLGIK